MNVAQRQKGKGKRFVNDAGTLCCEDKRTIFTSFQVKCNSSSQSNSYVNKWICFFSRNFNTKAINVKLSTLVRKCWRYRCWICVCYVQWLWQRQFLLASISIQFHFLLESFLLNVQITIRSGVGCVSWYLITQSGMTKHRRSVRYQRYEYSNIKLGHLDIICLVSRVLSI